MEFRTPRLYRYLEKGYVESFFNSGSLRLSSFNRFREHDDESRLDVDEGFAKFIHRTGDGRGETLIMDFECAPNVYTLCASALPSKKLMDKFGGADSAIVIWDPPKFAKSVTKALNQVTQVRKCIQGPCSYQFRRVVERDLGFLELGNEETDDWTELDRDKLNHVISEIISHDAYFLKREEYAHEAEYRFVWFVEEVADDFIDIDVPNARRFCSRWENQGEWIAVDNIKST